MKSYNAVGYSILIAYCAACIALAPPALGPVWGLLIGVIYMLVCWFLAGTYLADVLHLGIAHRSLDFSPTFMKAVTLVNNTFGVYVDPVGWVNRHRLHHRHSDHDGDPNKLADDGFWKTLWLCLFPYPTNANVANDDILKTWVFRLTARWEFAFVATMFNFALLAWLTGSWAFAAAIWIGMRVFALWVNMVQNYWTHTRSHGYRRYDDDHDNAMNIGEWLPVTATFSACLQNNHHHSPNVLRLSHDESEYDFGFMTIRWMKALGLVKSTVRGTQIPSEAPLQRLGF